MQHDSSLLLTLHFVQSAWRLLGAAVVDGSTFTSFSTRNARSFVRRFIYHHPYRCPPRRWLKN